MMIRKKAQLSNPVLMFVVVLLLVVLIVWTLKAKDSTKEGKRICNQNNLNYFDIGEKEFSKKDKILCYSLLPDKEMRFYYYLVGGG